MAKTPALKKRSFSSKSRAARRATSPSIDLGKSLAPANGPNDSTVSKSSVLAAREGGGVSKKKQQRPLKRQQRLRREKSIARADVVIDKRENKIDKSKTKGKILKQRRAAWEDLHDGRGVLKANKKEKARNLQENEVQGDMMRGLTKHDIVNAELLPSASDHIKSPNVDAEADEIT